MRKIMVAVVVAAAALVGCSKATTVGNPGLLKIKSPSASPTARATSAASKTKAPATVRPSPSKQARQTTTFELVIRDTRRGFEPQVFRVFAGTKVIFRNLDRNCPQRNTDPGCHHSWVADAGTWDSGSIAAGKSWPYVANKVGKFRFHDGEVPYNIGQMEVLPAP
jgi:plastocyanin